MTTITNKRIIQTLLENDGHYPGDPQVDAIYEYIGGGGVAWAVFYRPQDDDMASSPYVGHHVLLWSRRTGHVAPLGVLEGAGR